LLLLGCPDVDARDQDALRRPLGWHRLGRLGDRLRKNGFM
jgi:hypothetical protein